MSGISDDAAKALQRDVQRLLGRCMLRLQQYEGQIKRLVAHGALSATAGKLKEARDARVTKTARQTLGQLVGEFLGSHLVGGKPEDLPETASADGPDGAASFSYRMQLSLPEEEFKQVNRDLGDLVQMRNDLVHHFIDQNDLWSVEGCRSAQEVLIAAYDRIDQSYALLLEWAEDMEQARLQMLEGMQSKVVRDLLVYGIAPDGSIYWPNTEIVRVLRRAAGALEIDGWASVASAVTWIEMHHPAESPAKYLRKTWKQVVHESQAFELRYFGDGEERAARYRERRNSPRKDTTETEWSLDGSGHLLGHAPKE